MDQTSTPVRRSRTTIVRLALASVAVLGVGAAITTAAWTDQAWFTAEASTAHVELYGALAVDGVCPSADPDLYDEADDLAGAVQITLASGSFAGLVPGDERAVGICLFNGATVPLSVSLGAPDLTDDPVFGGADPADLEVQVAGAAFATQTLAANTVLPLDVVVTTPDPWSDEMQDQTSGVIELVFTGSTDLP